MAHPYWPLFDLVIRTPRVELRLGTDAELVELAALAGRGIHDPSWQPLGGWTDQPSPQLERGVLQYQWAQRAQWKATMWRFDPIVFVDGQVVGTQGVHAFDFSKLRVVNTGSWLGREHQGKGIGKEMRAAILHLAFEGLGAREAKSGYWHDNVPSARVSAALGYEPNGVRWVLRRDEADRQLHVRLPRETWEARRRDDIQIEGLEPCLELFGAAEPSEAPAP